MFWLLFACTASPFDTASFGGQSGSESASECESGELGVITESTESSELEPRISSAAGSWSGALELSGGVTESLDAIITQNDGPLQRFEPTEADCSPYFSLSAEVVLDSDAALQESRSGELRLYDDTRTTLVLEIPEEELQGDLTAPTANIASLRITAELSADTWRGLLFWEGDTTTQEGTFTLER